MISFAAVLTAVSTSFVCNVERSINLLLVKERLLPGRRIVCKSRSELHLTCQAAVKEFFAIQRPRYVIIAAAKVGRIHANSTYQLILLLAISKFKPT